MGDARVRVRVKPGSRATPSVVEGPDGVLVVTVRERAIEGAANAAVEAALAGHFGVAKRDVRVVAGAAARIKTVAIGGVDPVDDGRVGTPRLGRNVRAARQTDEGR